MTPSARRLLAIRHMQANPDDIPIKRAFDGQRRHANLDRAIAVILAGPYITETAHRFGREARTALSVLPAGETRDTLAALAATSSDRDA